MSSREGWCKANLVRRSTKEAFLMCEWQQEQEAESRWVGPAAASPPFPWGQQVPGRRLHVTLELCTSWGWMNTACASAAPRMLQLADRPTATSVNYDLLLLKSVYTCKCLNSKMLPEQGLQTFACWALAPWKRVPASICTFCCQVLHCFTEIRSDTYKPSK